MEGARKPGKRLLHPDICVAIGDTIRRLREADDLSVAELAACVDSQPQTIRDLERGRHSPSFPMLLDLFYALDASEEDFCEILRRDGAVRQAGVA